MNAAETEVTELSIHEVRLYDVLCLEDGRTGQVVDLPYGNTFLVNVKTNGKHDTILVGKKQIAEIRPAAMTRRVSQIRKWFHDDPTDRRLARVYALVEREYTYYWHDEDWYHNDEMELACARGKTRIWETLLDELVSEIFSRLSFVPPDEGVTLQEYVDAIASFMTRNGYTYRNYRWGPSIINKEQNEKEMESGSP